LLACLPACLLHQLTIFDFLFTLIDLLSQKTKSCKQASRENESRNTHPSIYRYTYVPTGVIIFDSCFLTPPPIQMNQTNDDLLARELDLLKKERQILNRERELNERERKISIHELRLKKREYKVRGVGCQCSTNQRTKQYIVSSSRRPAIHRRYEPYSSNFARPQEYITRQERERESVDYRRNNTVEKMRSKKCSSRFIRSKAGGAAPEKVNFHYESSDVDNSPEEGEIIVHEEDE
jgi:hypothetical protein